MTGSRRYNDLEERHGKRGAAMKIFQPQWLCMKGQRLTVDQGQGIPSDVYPNAKTYCYHDFYELEFFEQGDGFHHLNSVPYTVKPGCLYFLFPGDFHYMQLNTDVRFSLWNLKMTRFEPHRELIGEIAKYPRPYCVYLDHDETEFVVNEFRFLLECNRNGKWNYEMQRSTAERILSVLLYKLDQRSEAVVLPEKEPIWKAIDYLSHNYSSPITLKELASEMQMSEHYVGAWFNNHTGMHVSDYLNQTRLFHAAGLLEESQLTVKEIANRVGFSSPEYMTRLFTANLGISPMLYRKKMKPG